MPIPVEQRITAVIFSFALLLVIVQLIRKHRLREEYSLVWLAAAIGILFFSLFGGFATLLANLFAVSYAPTLFLVFGLLFALGVLLSQSVALSTQSNRLRDLAPHVALLEWQLRQNAKDGPHSGQPDAGENGRPEQERSLPGTAAGPAPTSVPGRGGPPP